MTAPTIPVTVRLADFGGPALAGVVVRARMNMVDATVAGTFVGTEEVTATTDETGTAVLNVFPNALEPLGLGTTGSLTLFTARPPLSQSLRVWAAIPNQPCNLIDALVADPPESLTSAQIAVAQARSYASAAALGMDAYLVDYVDVRAYEGAALSVYVGGYLGTAAPAHIAGWFTRDDIDRTTADNSGTVLVGVNGVRWKRRIEGAVNILWFIPSEEHAGILTEDSTYDCSPAIDAAMHVAIAGAPYTTLSGLDDSGNTVTRAQAGNWYFAAPEVYFPPGRYRCLSTIVIDRQIKLSGTASGIPQGSGSVLSFPGGVPGIIVNNFDTDGLSTGSQPNGGAWPTPIAGNGAIIEGLSLRADTISRFRTEPSTADDLIAWPHGHQVFLENGPSCSSNPAYGLPNCPPGGFYETVASGNVDAHGIRIRGMCLVRNCFIFGFEGSGVYLNCTFGIPTGLEHGNGNLFRLEGVACVRNAQHGIFIEGGDSNAGYGIGINVTQNGKCGIYDSSFLGNTWIACHANTNFAEQYKTDNANASTVFLNCYSETGGLPSSFANGTLVLGGAQSAGISGTPSFLQAAGVAGLRSYAPVEAPSLSIGLQNITDHNTARDSGYALRYQDTTATTGSPSYWSLNREVGRLVWQKANVGAALSYYDAGCTVANGYARNFTDAPMTSVGQIGLGTHFFGGKTEMKYRGLSTVAPTTGEYLKGDIIWSSIPAAAGKMGWVCTTGGTAGSTAVFKQFGTIDP
jgi:hypothetical protein